MITPAAGWLPLAGLALTAVFVLWHFGHEPKDPMRRYITDMARAHRRLDRRIGR